MVAIKSIPYSSTTHTTNVSDESGYTNYSSTTAYTVGALVFYNCNRYKCLVANTGKLPDVSTEWAPLGVKNNCAMFDYSNSTATTSTAAITVTILDSNSEANAIAIMGMEGVSFQVKQKETIGNTYVYDSGVIDMVETSSITDWFSYFFGKRDRKKNFIVSNLAPQIASKLELTVNPDATTGAKVAGVFFGTTIVLGKSTWGSKIGIESKSIYTDNGFGTTIVKRGSEQYINATIEIPAYDTARLMTIMKSMKDEVYPFYIPNKEEESLTTGFFKDFSIALELPTRNIITLDIKGVL